MAGWKCDCGKENPLWLMNCTSCGCEISRREIRRIAKIELEIHVKEVREKRRKRRQKWYRAADYLTKWPLRAGLSIFAILFFAWCVYFCNPDEISVLLDGNNGTAQRITGQIEHRYIRFKDEKIGDMIGKVSCFTKVKKMDKIPLILEKGKYALEERGDKLENKGDKVLQKCEEFIKDKAVYTTDGITEQKEKGSEE